MEWGIHCNIFEALLCVLWEVKGYVLMFLVKILQVKLLRCASFLFLSHVHMGPWIQFLIQLITKLKNCCSWSDLRFVCLLIFVFSLLIWFTLFLLYYQSWAMYFRRLEKLVFLSMPLWFVGLLRSSPFLFSSMLWLLMVSVIFTNLSFCFHLLNK